MLYTTRIKTAVYITCNVLYTHKNKRTLTKKQEKGVIRLCKHSMFCYLHSVENISFSTKLLTFIIFITFINKGLDKTGNRIIFRSKQYKPRITGKENHSTATKEKGLYLSVCRFDLTVKLEGMACQL